MGARRFLLLLLGVQSSAIFERRVERSSHNCGDGEYLHQDYCCKYCPAGTYVYNHCELPHTEGKCYPCTAGKDYTAHANGLDECIRCKFCKEDEVIVSTCTLMSDTECQCKPGYFCPTPGCEMCHRCKSKCPEGKEIVQKCNATVDLECGHPPKGTANVAGWIAGVVIFGFVLLVVVCLLLLKKRISYNKTNKENKDAEKYVESEDSTEIFFAPEMENNASILEIQNSVQSPPVLAVNSPDSALRNELPEDTSVAFSERSGLLLHGENNLSEESYHRTAGYSAPVRPPDKPSSVFHSGQSNGGMSLSQMVRDSEARPHIKVKELSQEEVPSRNWNMFMRTHLTDNEIDQTTYEHPKNIEEQYYQMLIIWRNKFGNEASIIKLLDSLWTIGLRRSHENIVNHLISKDIITILEAKD